jgi:hypothetical protein
VSGEQTFRLMKGAGHRWIAHSLRAECGSKFLRDRHPRETFLGEVEDLSSLIHSLTGSSPTYFVSNLTKKEMHTFTISLEELLVSAIWPPVVSAPER